MKTDESMILRIESKETAGNSYLIIENGAALLIDVTDADRIAALLNSHNWKPERILLTHEHVDHISGLEQLRSYYGTPVTASAACSRRICDPQTNLSKVYDLLAYSITGTICSCRHMPFSCRPCETVFEKQLNLLWRGHSFQLDLCPGHSPGSAIIQMDHTYAFTGDYLMPDLRDDFSLPGASTDAYETLTLPWIRQNLRAGMMIFPGHGDPYVYCGQPAAQKTDA